MKQLPFFLLYSYPKKLKSYYKIKNHNKNVIDQKDKLVLNAYHSPSPMNELADYICAWERQNIQWDRSVIDTSCLILDNSLDLNNKEIIKKVKHVINDFAIEWTNICKEQDNDDNILDLIIHRYKKELDKILNNPTLLANYVIKVSYSNNSINKTLAWSGYGDTIISNLKMNTPKQKNTMIFEVPEYWDDCYEYLGKYYMMVDGKNNV